MKYRVLNGLMTLGQWPAHRAFRQAVDDPDGVQEKLLLNILERNRRSAYGRRWGFEGIRSARDYQARVPMVTYEDIAPWIDRVRLGEQEVLTTEPVLMFETTGGASAASKYIPYTRSLREEFTRAASAWIHDLQRNRPGLRGGPGYWSISPAAREREVTSGGIPVGFEEDTEYFGGLLRKVLGELLVGPPALARVSDVIVHRYITLLHLLGCRELRLLSVWNPSFLTLLMAALPEHEAALIRDLAAGTLHPPGSLDPGLTGLLAPRAPDPGRASELDSIRRTHGHLPPGAVWPRLDLISCWTAASSALFLPALESLFPGVAIQPKGLLATEGFVSFPVSGHAGSALALTSHFLEFLPVDGDETRPRLAGELEIGATYTVLLTTGGGLYRYGLGDEIEVVDLLESCPLIRFRGRRGHVSDLCGEKLVDSFVGEAIGRVLGRAGVAPRFAMLAPEDRPAPRYILFLEPTPAETRTAGILEDLDRELCRNPQYAYCRRLGQLGAPGLVGVVSGVERYLAACQGRGQKPGSIKPTSLSKELGWREKLCGNP